MTKVYTITVNGKEKTVAPHPDQKLLDVIREDLGLTGTKRGCDNSTCGACTVVLNGRAVKSCNTTMEKADGGFIFTIEGLQKEGKLHPIQKALSESGAIQCGFCTPGIAMELYAILTETPEAEEKKIINALNKHLCRCTGYEAIKDGAMVAQQLVKEMNSRK